jgi:hypothetical protein
MSEIIESVKLVSRMKGTNQPWRPLNIRATSPEDAWKQIRKKSRIVSNALELAIRVVTLYVNDDNCEHGIPGQDYCKACHEGITQQEIDQSAQDYKDAARIQ